MSMWRNVTLRLPKTPEGTELAEALRKAATGPRNSLAALLAHASMVWVCSDRSMNSWTPLKVRETVRCRIDSESVITAPVYKAWEASQTQMPFADWLAMAIYYGFVRAKKDPLLWALFSPFCGEGEVRAEDIPSDSPPEAKPKSTAKPKKKEPEPGKPSAGVKKLKGMF